MIDIQSTLSKSCCQHFYSVVQFHFESATHFIQEDRASVTVTVIKDGSNDIPVSIAIVTQPFEAQGN